MSLYHVEIALVHFNLEIIFSCYSCAEIGSMLLSTCMAGGNRQVDIASVEQPGCPF